MTTEQSDEAWVLLKPDYDAVAIPVSLFADIARHMKRVKVDYNGVCSISDSAMNMQLVPADVMKVAVIKQRMITSTEADS